MGQTIEYICDVCGKEIKKGHQQLYMVTITVDSVESIDDGSAAGHEDVSHTYHVHNDFTRHCMTDIWKLLSGGKKDEDSGT